MYCAQGWGSLGTYVLRARLAGLVTYCAQGWGSLGTYVLRTRGGGGGGGLGRGYPTCTSYKKRVLSLVFPHLWYFGQKASVHCTTTGSRGQTKPDHQQTTASRTHLLLQTAANHLLPHLQPQRHCMTLPYVKNTAYSPLHLMCEVHVGLVSLQSESLEQVAQRSLQDGRQPRQPSSLLL